jgi:hypothetical protein
VSTEEILHKLIDVVSGRSNLPAHEADALHEEITPGFTDKPLTAEEEERLEALQARQDRLAADRAARLAPPAPAVAPAPAPADRAPSETSGFTPPPAGV